MAREPSEEFFCGYVFQCQDHTPTDLALHVKYQIRCVGVSPSFNFALTALPLKNENISRYTVST